MYRAGTGICTPKVAKRKAKPRPRNEPKESLGLATFFYIPATHFRARRNCGILPSNEVAPYEISYLAREGFMQRIPIFSDATGGEIMIIIWEAFGEDGPLGNFVFAKYAPNSSRLISVVFHIDDVEGPDGSEAHRTFFKGCKHLSIFNVNFNEPDRHSSRQIRKENKFTANYQAEKDRTRMKHFGQRARAKPGNVALADQFGTGTDLDQDVSRLSRQVPHTARNFVPRSPTTSTMMRLFSSDTEPEEKPAGASRASVKRSAAEAPDEPVDLDPKFVQVPKTKRSAAKAAEQARHQALMKVLKDDLDKATNTGVSLKKQCDKFRNETIE
ncbi:hypothetical protein QFC21_002470 [Naganishia friedmannii]|uniref:Uncharacterized protein n=1 Tax=Naganishia friedmannii TaxID=89922 RepID=A0ACC2VV19_9TREE|nr:hypothetical protein QFC21_002470 [Naganishia friedmannii]